MNIYQNLMNAKKISTQYQKNYGTGKKFKNKNSISFWVWNNEVCEKSFLWNVTGAGKWYDKILLLSLSRLIDCFLAID
jgi:hypothetical protein